MKRGLALSVVVHGLAAAGMLAYLGECREWKPSDDAARALDLDVGMIEVGKKKLSAPQTPVALPVGAPASEPAAESAPGVAATAAPQAVPEPAKSPRDATVTSDLGGGTQVLSVLEYIQWVRAHNEAPNYPRLAKTRSEQGRSVIRVVVSDRGVLEQAVLEKSSGYPVLDGAALENVRSWRFPPFKSGASRLVVKIPFKFSLEER
ncbi:MAG: energy transducer TonB [Deltaproteobacteria bacterium]|nr:energy transducer TonB [Deltaproteobacteria bacterium]